jgi:membrane protein implicated in regulation of membrane protease activity
MALRTVSFIALAATIVPSLLYLSGTLTLDGVMWAALAGTIVWFVVTPLWMDRKREVDDTQVQI